MSVQKLIGTILDNKTFHKQVSKIINKQDIQPRYGKLGKPLPHKLDEYLTRNQIRLYTHQADVIEKVRADYNVALVTATASGKTLAFTLPVLEKLWSNPDATALFLYPMKALSYDQLEEIKELERGTGINLNAAVYDGDTPKEKRKNIRENSRLILSNPHALHWYLSWHRLWDRFFRNLQFVVIDEGHWYRGIYGTNVAFLLRRLLRILEFYRSDPQFIISSATMADPLEHAEALTGKHFKLISSDGSSQGKKTYLFWDTAVAAGRSQHLQTADMTAACVQHGLQTLCFSVSRKMAELTAAWANKMARDADIVPYRAGYLPGERRELEQKFKGKSIAGIISTNALELGVNIGGLDAVVIGGYPGTITSFHQRAGRAGRAGQESVVIQMLYDNPLDTYILANPAYLFEEPSEQAVISLGNRQIMKNHVMCAAEEIPLVKEDGRWFGEEYENIVRELIKEKTVYIKNRKAKERSSISKKQYAYKGTGSFFKVNLSDIDGNTYRLISGGQVLEELSRRQAYYEAHPGAIFLHKASSYQVVEFDDKARSIVLKPYDREMYTTPLRETRIKTDKIVEKRNVGDCMLYYGKVNVTEEVYAYMLHSFNKTIGKNLIENSLVLQYHTEAVWVSFKKLRTGNTDGGLHATEHLLIGVAPLLAMCDRWDLGGVSVSSSREVFLYDGFPEGIGISERLFQYYELLAKKGLDVITSCPCEAGCPKCIMSPKCGNNNEPLDKWGAREILLSLVQHFEYDGVLKQKIHGG